MRGAFERNYCYHSQCKPQEITDAGCSTRQHVVAYRGRALKIRAETPMTGEVIWHLTASEFSRGSDRCTRRTPSRSNWRCSRAVHAWVRVICPLKDHVWTYHASQIVTSAEALQNKIP